MKLTLEEYQSLSSPTISHKAYDEIISRIDDRFDYIIRYIGKVDWWDYINGHGEKNGYFEPEFYHDETGSYDNLYIELDGKFTLPPPYDCPEIPIRWLWEDFEEEFKTVVEAEKAHILKKKEDGKNKRAILKVRKAEMKEIISKKLTKEEMKFIKFK